MQQWGFSEIGKGSVTYGVKAPLWGAFIFSQKVNEGMLLLQGAIRESNI